MSRPPVEAAELLVVGAGAAGLMAAGQAALRGVRVLLLEANREVGQKVRISGGGRCNVTHDAEPEAFLRVFPQAQRRFLREALHRFPPERLRGFLAQQGLPTESRPDGRVFPLGGPGSARLVVEALQAWAQAAGVRLQTGVRVARLERKGDTWVLELQAGASLRAPRLLLATGGASYPQTGTLGEGWGWLQGLGLPMVPWRPALAPIHLEVPRPAWEGVALRGGTLHLCRQAGTRRLASQAGDLVFTRAGISGPAVLALSEAAALAKAEGGGWLTYAFTPLAPEQLEADLVAAQSGQAKVGLRSWLHRWLPERLLEDFLREQGLERGPRLAELNRDLRRLCVEAVTQFPLGNVKGVPLAKGEVSAGGLALSAVDPATCRVRTLPTLQVCGELLDLHGPVGGYNLQAAFSTGFLAGISPDPS